MYIGDGIYDVDEKFYVSIYTLKIEVYDVDDLEIGFG